MWQVGKEGGVKRKDEGGKKKKRKKAMGMEKESRTAWFPLYIEFLFLFLLAGLC